MVEVLSLNEKFRFFKAVTNVPKGIAENVERLVALRNGIAHAFFPENLRAAKRLPPKRVGIWSYKGKDIFTVDSIRAFIDDTHSHLEFYRARDFLQNATSPYAFGDPFDCW